MQVFQIENNVVKPTPEILLVPPFSDIWARDTTERKEYAIKEFTYIELMCSPRKTNPYYGYDSELRSKRIIEEVFKGGSFTPDALVHAAMARYQEFFYEASPGFAYLKVAKDTAKGLKDWFRTIDYNKVTKTGAPVYTPKQVIDALDNTETVLRKLADAEKKVQEEVYTTSKTKGDKEINPLER